MTRRIAVLAALAVLAGCKAGPDYQRPVAETPAGYKEAGNWKPAQPRDDAVRGPWWEVFRDPQLDRLVEQVEVSNQDVLLAEAKLRQARAVVQSSRAGLFPTLTGNVAVTRSRSPAGVTGGTAAGRVLTNHSADLEASWEPDLWGRLRRALEGSEAGAQASAADLALALLTAQAELVSDYFQLRILDEQQQLLDDTVTALRKSLELTNNRYVAGVAGKVDVVQAETQLRTTQAQAIDVGVQRAQFEHAIAVLMGKPPAEFSIARTPVVLTMPEIPAGLPSELLERRPDIAGAERRVAAANAQIGVARAAFFPSLTLSGSIGFRSTDLSQWFTAPSRFWSLGPALAQAIFDAGLRRAAEAQAVAGYDASVATYRQAVLSGFQEVEDNLAALRLLEEEARVQDEAVRASREAVVLTVNQYKAGTVSYLSVVTVQNTQLSNERTAAGILGRRLAASVALIRALGGGWQEPLAGTSR